MANPIEPSVTGQQFFYGEGVRKSYKRAFPYLLGAARRGDGHCQNLVGYCYDLGLGVEADDEAAVRWYKRAAANNDLDGLFNLALHYASGRGIKANAKRAFFLYLRAARLGDLQSQCNVGIAYLEGLGTPENLLEGINWTRKAARRGDSRAQYNLGMAYLHGDDGVRQNHRLARLWLRKASDQGHKRAHRKLKTLQVCTEGREGS